MAKKKKKGGRNRINPSEKVILVGFYTKKSVVDTLGGMETARSYAKETIENQAAFIRLGQNH